MLSSTGTNRQHKCHQSSRSVSALMAALLIRERACCGQQGPRRSLVVMAPLCKCEGLRLHSLCSRLVVTLFVGRRQQCCSLVANASAADSLARAALWMSSRSMSVRIASRGATRSSHVAWMRLLLASKKFGNTTSWRGCLPARELAADSAAHVAASC
jgi:hypothetical protein